MCLHVFFTDSWIGICSPFIPKYLSSPRSVCVDGTIYLVADNTKKVYSYDPEVNMWQKVGLYITADYSHNVVIQSLVSMLIKQDYSNNNQFYSPIILPSLSSGPASPHAP